MALRDHTIIAGYGINGRNLAQVLRETEISFVIVEMDGDVVRQEQKKSVPIYFGDVTHPQTLATIRHPRCAGTGPGNFRPTCHSPRY